MAGARRLLQASLKLIHQIRSDQLMFVATDIDQFVTKLRLDTYQVTSMVLNLAASAYYFSARLLRPSDIDAKDFVM